MPESQATVDGPLRRWHRPLPLLVAAALGLSPLWTGLFPASSHAADQSGAPPVVISQPTIGRFGLNGVLTDYAYVPGEGASLFVPWLRWAREAGASASRFVVEWPMVQPRPDPALVFLDPVWDRAEAYRRAGLEPVAVLIGTPPWAGPAPNAPPRGLGAPVFRPDGQVNPANPWAAFVFRAVSRLQPVIRYWQIWNEPNRPEFWAGSAEDYYLLLKTAYLAAKAANPAAVVVMGGLEGFRQIGFLDQVLTLATTDPQPVPGGAPFDVLAWHTYSRARDLYTGTQVYRQRLRRYGLERPIWVTETNVPAWDDPLVRGPAPRPYQWSATQAEQAAFIVQALAYAVAADSEHVSVFRANDMGQHEAWGLWRADGSARPALLAYRVATRYLGGVRRARLLAGPGYEAVLADAGDRRVWVLWATDRSSVVVVVPAWPQARARLVTRTGEATSLRAEGSVYRLVLAGATADQGTVPGDILIGGEPVLIVETLDAGLRPE